MNKLLVAVALVASLVAVAGSEAPPQPTLKVLATGKDPKPLRLTPKAGTKRTIVSTTKESMGRGLEGQVGPLTQGATIRMTLDVSIPEASTTQFRSELVYRKPEVLGDKSKVPQEVLAALDGFEGIKGSIVATSRGIALDVKVTGGTGAAAASMQMMQNILQQVFSAFPEEAVGIGGKWVTTSTIKSGELTVKVETTYELVERTGTKIKLKAAFKGVGRGSGTGNLTVKLNGTSEMEIDLAQGIPSRVQQESRTEVGLDFEGKRLGQINTSVTEMH